MKHLAALLAFACVSCAPVPAVAIELDGKTAVLSPAEILRMADCKDQGGCFIVTRRAMDALVMKTIEITLEEVAKDPPVCKRGLIL